MENNLKVITRALDRTLTTHAFKGIYYGIYFQLVNRVSGEVMDLLDRKLRTGEILFISDRVEKFLKEKFFEMKGF